MVRTPSCTTLAGCCCKLSCLYDGEQCVGDADGGECPGDQHLMSSTPLVLRNPYGALMGPQNPRGCAATQAAKHASVLHPTCADQKEWSMCRHAACCVAAAWICYPRSQAPVVQQAMLLMPLPVMAPATSTALPCHTDTQVRPTQLDNLGLVAARIKFLRIGPCV